MKKHQSKPKPSLDPDANAELKRQLAEHMQEMRAVFTSQIATLQEQNKQIIAQEINQLKPVVERTDALETHEQQMRMKDLQIEQLVMTV